MHRNLGLRGLNWDDDIPADHRKWWQHWIERLSELKLLSLPRCLFVRMEDIMSSELHTFCDASQEAFASAVYLRNVYINGEVTVRLVMAKSKLAPLKAVSVARLELQAALLGARLAAYVGRGLTKQIGRRRFWTDSSCVRNWIRSPAAYYKPYVSH
ncbi:hypothetical protein M514_26861 [Trichuris suis]|uniref:Pao retrotransposon peptidase n=1 Tax=Trichuris suis TaxID=68888 RepID=A0A085MUR7_9BILA|nr:hypothetical protein M514_26861 [Trichuris suis]